MEKRTATKSRLFSPCNVMKIILLPDFLDC